MKSQAALEYLTTYGWALLVIAVVIILLAELNVFNPNFWTAKQQPGMCTVLRSQFGSASLSCSGTSLLPEFVMQLNGNGYVSIPNSALIDSGNQYTISVWVKTAYATNTIIWTAGDGRTSGYQLYLYNGYPALWTPLGTIISSKLVNDNSWHQIVGVFPSTGAGSVYVDRVISTSNSIGSIATSGNNLIGSQPISGYNLYYYGNISNVQLYNTSLSSNVIQELYVKGIGGAPITLQNLVGWWPLNGNANDYSGTGPFGKGDSGTATNAIYTNDWYSNYITP